MMGVGPMSVDDPSRVRTCELTEHLMNYLDHGNTSSEHLNRGMPCLIFHCTVCNKDLSHMDANRRNQHINRCLDGNEQQTYCAAVDQTDDMCHNIPLYHTDETLSASKNKSPLNVQNVCPLCGKVFKELQLLQGHLKPCMKRKNCSKDQMLKAFDLQKKFMEDRENVGLPALFPNLSRNKRSRTTRVKVPKNETEEQIHMAIAMSLSSKEEEDRKRMKKDSFNLFRPTSMTKLLPFDNCIPEIMKQKKNQMKFKNNDVPLLMLRTEAERKKLLEQRVMSIFEDTIVGTRVQSPALSLQIKPTPGTSRLRKIAKPNAPCWSVANQWQQKSKNYLYVDKLKQFFSQAEPKNKITYFLQVSGNLQQSPPELLTSLNNNVPSTQDVADMILGLVHADDNFTVVSQKQPSFMPESSSFSLQTSTVENGQGFLRTNELVEDEKITSKIDSFKQKLLSQMKNLFDTGLMQDIIIRSKGGKIFGAHKAFFAIRCPEVLKDLKMPNEIVSSLPFIDWYHVSSSAAQSFLEFVYTAECKYEVNAQSEIMSLAVRYNFKDLLDYLQHYSLEHEDIVVTQMLKNVCEEELQREEGDDQVDVEEKDENFEEVYTYLCSQINTKA